MSVIKNLYDLKTAADFYEFFEVIPDEKWTTGAYADEKDRSVRCAIGHCGIGVGISSGANIDVAKRLRLLISGNDSGRRVADINDGRAPEYQQPTPKARILAALQDKIAAAATISG